MQPPHRRWAVKLKGMALLARTTGGLRIARYVLLSALLSAAAPAQAQTPAWEWAWSTGGVMSDYAYALTTDAAGNSYRTGYIVGQVDLNPAPGEAVVQVPSGTGIHVLKSGPDGQYLWGRVLMGAGYNAGGAVAVDAQGNAYVTGHFEGPIDIDTGPGEEWVCANGENDLFVAKYAPSGQLLRFDAIGGPGYAYGADVAPGTAGQNAVFLAGAFADTLDMDSGSGVTLLETQGELDGFLARFDTSGQLVWARSFGGTGAVQMQGLAVDPAEGIALYTVGGFTGTADLVPDTSAADLHAAGGRDGFLSKFNGIGHMEWAFSLGGTGFDALQAVAVDTAGDRSIIVVGDFQGTVDADPGPGMAELTSAGDYDVLVAKYDRFGGLVWAKSLGGSSYEKAFDVLVDPGGSGAITLTGHFSGTADLDPDPVASHNVTSAGNIDGFVLQLDADGGFRWAKTLGGGNPDYGQALAPAVDGGLLVAGGYFSATVQLDGITLVNAYSGGASGDFFLAKLERSFVSVGEQSLPEAFRVFPNPVADALSFRAPELHAVLAIGIYDGLGRCVRRGRVPLRNGLGRVDGLRLPAGPYLLRLGEGEKGRTAHFIVD